MKNIRTIISIIFLLFAIGFNLWTYRQELTAKTDPNDNTFQFALVYRTNQIWDFANKTCPKNLSFVICHLSFLSDHWVPNWAQGYNLPYYYSHIPQIMIVGSYRFFHWSIGLFQYYHLIIYLLLCFFPLSLFLALRIIGLSWISAGIGALIASHLSTDGLYGLDPASFLWRGYGLSSQLFAMIWLPLTVAYAHRLFTQLSDDSQHTLHRNIEKRSNPLSQNASEGHGEITKLASFVPAILALSFTTACHLGIGIIAFMSIGIIFLSTLSRLNYQSNIKKLLLIYGGVLLLLGYWIIPILLGGNFHNISVWDPIWKFDSYGFREVLKNLFNGDLFDFGRFPILTLLTGFGFFTTLLHDKGSAFSSRLSLEYRKVANTSSAKGDLQTSQSASIQQYNNYFGFAALFLFWLLFYFGRTTWGGLVDLIPSMEEFHLSRFIVGLHIAGLFLIPIGVEWLVTKFSKHAIIRLFIYSFIGIFIYLTVYPQTLRYSAHNDLLIKQANDNFKKIESDTAALLVTINNLQLTNSGRVYFGRGGGWGKDFRVAETPMYLYMSTFGIPTLTWLPETWSPNSDTEQYFSEDVAAHYMLYNIKYVMTPIDLPKENIQPFWKPLKTSKTWRLYSIVIPDLIGDPVYNTLDSRVRGNDNNSGYISTGLRPAIVSTTKQTFTNVVRLWIQSDTHTKGLYPELTFDTDYPKKTCLPAGRPCLPNFRMIDEVTYKVPDASTHNLFAETPSYLSDLSILGNLKITSQSNNTDMIFKATVDVPDGCTECIVILHQTYHPSWRATVDGKTVESFAVFPFYTAVKLESKGLHEVIFSYEPSFLKQFLLIIALTVCMIFAIIHTYDYYKHFSSRRSKKRC